MATWRSFLTVEQLMRLWRDLNFGIEAFSAQVMITALTAVIHSDTLSWSPIEAEEGARPDRNRSKTLHRNLFDITFLGTLIFPL